MTLQSICCLSIIISAQILFFSGKIRAELVGVLALIALHLSGIISSKESLTGFSDPALITVATMFIISASLSASGVSAVLSKIIVTIGKNSYYKLLIIILILSAFLSAFMNNIAVTALMLPIVMEVSKLSLISPSLFLIPMSFAVLLGGTTTLIGTPPNILVSSILQANGYEKLSFFSFTPIGGLCTLVGLSYLILFSGKFLKPKRSTSSISLTQNIKVQELNKNNFIVELTPESNLIGSTLFKSRLGIGLGVTILSIRRGSNTFINPDSETKLQAGDQLLAHGDTELLNELISWQNLEYSTVLPEQFEASDFSLNEFKLKKESKLIGKKLFEISLSETFGVKVMAIYRKNEVLKKVSGSTILEQDDLILIYGQKAGINLLIHTNQLEFIPETQIRKLIAKYRINKRIFFVAFPESSGLIGKSIKETKLSKRFNLRILVIKRGENYFVAHSSTIINQGDQLLVFGHRHEIKILNALQNIKIKILENDLSTLVESNDYTLTEATILDNSVFIDQTIREINFRDRYQSQIVSVWRGDQIYSSDLSNFKLKSGDSLILLTEKKQLQRLSVSTQLILLTERRSLRPDFKKVTIASLAMIVMVISIIFDFVSLEIAGMSTALFLILSKCINAEKAYLAIDIKTIILIATTIPYGIAMKNSGTAELLANYLLSLTQTNGTILIVSSLYLITMLMTLSIPNQAVVLIMAPIALSIAKTININQHNLMIVIAVAASSSFFSPLSHGSNLLVMGAGNYGFSDYLKLGFGLAILVFLTCITYLFI